jgi:hypothetical protein
MADKEPKKKDFETETSSFGWRTEITIVNKTLTVF